MQNKGQQIIKYLKTDVSNEFLCKKDRQERLHFKNDEENAVHSLNK